MMASARPMRAKFQDRILGNQEILEISSFLFPSNFGTKILI